MNDPDVTPPLMVTEVFVYETEKELLPVLGSPKARVTQAEQQLAWWRRRTRRRSR
jgi:hypothetical protein